MNQQIKDVYYGRIISSLIPIIEAQLKSLVYGMVDDTIENIEIVNNTGVEIVTSVERLPHSVVIHLTLPK